MSREGSVVDFGLLPAYIDPGSGTLALQAILAGMVGSIFCLRGLLTRTAALLLRRRRAEADAQD